jgi:hypothetical protein
VLLSVCLGDLNETTEGMDASMLLVALVLVGLCLCYTVSLAAKIIISVPDNQRLAPCI